MFIKAEASPETSNNSINWKLQQVAGGARIPIKVVFFNCLAPGGLVLEHYA
jgi:hypothetical protein